VSLINRPKELAEEWFIKNGFAFRNFTEKSELEKVFTQAMNEAIEACIKRLEITLVREGRYITPEDVRALKIEVKE
jgi:hypothetical protein